MKSNKKYEDLIGIYSFDGWFAIPYKFFRICPSIESAVVLGHLINQARIQLKDKDKRKELIECEYWFTCPSLSIQKMLKVTKRIQTRAIKELEEAGFIHVKYKGIPRRRHVKIEIEEIHEREESEEGYGKSNENSLESVEETPNKVNESSGKTKENEEDLGYKTVPQVTTDRSDWSPRIVATNIRNNINKTNNVRSCKQDLTVGSSSSPSAPDSSRQSDLSRTSTKQARSHSPPRSGFFSKDKETPFEDILTSQLHYALKSKNKIYRQPKLSEWKKEFRDLVWKDGVPKEQVKESLDWYCDRIGGEYIPQAFSAKSFREKYSQIKSAIERESARDDKNNIPEFSKEEDERFLREIERDRKRREKNAELIDDDVMWTDEDL